ncbi:MAG TPA: ABC transporter permease [Candidatus Acidoferrum sp.]|jgi:putative ABC transport system permease protein
MTTLMQNLRYAFRALIKNPAFTLVVIVTLALGIGANTAIFSVVYAALLRPLPFHQPDRLLALGESRKQLENTTEMAEASYPDYLDWMRSAKTLQSIAGYGGDAFTLATGGEPKNIFAGQVTTNFFSTLGVKPALGRDFVDGENQADGPHVAILSDAFWRSEFSADPNIVNRVVRLDGKPATIIGVLPRNFEFAPANSAPVWVPIHQGGDFVERRSLRWLRTIGRMAPGATADQVRTEMQGITAQLSRAYPKEDAATYFVMEPLANKVVGKVRPLLLTLLSAVGFVLLITCANVANLLLTRSIGRRKEFAVRAALGASRRNLLWQLLTESLLLSAFGAAVGLVIAQWGVGLLVSAIPEAQLQSMPYLRAAGTNVPVLLFLCAITLLTGILFGLAPGLSASRSTFNEILKEESRGGTSSGHARLRNTLVVAEIATSLVLLVGAGLMLQSLRALLGQDPGFDAHNVLSFSVNLPDTSYPSDKAYPNDSVSAIQFDHEFTRRVRSLPGVVDVGASAGIPDSGGSGSIRFLEEGHPKEVGQEDECSILPTTTGYFSAMKIPLVEGREYTEGDTLKTPRVAVVNRSFAKTFFPDEEVVGKRIRFTFNPKEPFRQIVGVVGDTVSINLDEAPSPIIYVPNDQGSMTYLSYLVRTVDDPAGSVNAARGVLHGMDPQLPLIEPKSLEAIANQSPSVFLRRYPSYLIGSFAALAVILAMVGLYGLIAYMVQQRTREIGIRVALGAQRRDILQMVLRQGIRSSLVGVTIGVVAGLGLTRLMASLLYGVKPGDGFTFAGAAMFLVLVAVAACLIPARRAVRVDPVDALRHE